MGLKGLGELGVERVSLSLGLKGLGELGVERVKVDTLSAQARCLSTI